MYNQIDKVIREQIEKGRGRFAIYPLGKNGLQVKEILNVKYGIKEALIVDNGVCNYNPDVIAFEEVKNYEDYTWLITCNNPSVRCEIEESIKNTIPEDSVVYIFNSTKQGKYGDEYKRLKQIGTPNNKTVSASCSEFLEIIKKKKLENRKIAIAEIGACIDATAVEACKLLEESDTYYCFDFENVVEELLHDLKIVPEINCNLVGKGNTNKIYDSYNWNLSNMLFEMRNDNLDGIFDVVYLDGAHTFLHDGLACCLLKEMVKKDGYLIFDDLYWSFATSSGLNPKVRPEIKQKYTDDQIEDCQVRRVVNAFMINDARFQEVYLGQSLNPSRGIFKRII